jgi:hypothetical protein
LNIHGYDPNNVLADVVLPAASGAKPFGPVLIVADGPIAPLARAAIVAAAPAPSGLCIIGTGGGIVTAGTDGAE